MKYIFAYGGYLILTYTKYLEPLMCLWLVLALPLFLVRPVRYKATLILWLLIPLIACSVMPRKALWYALPFVPPLALVTAAGLAAIRSRWVKATAMMVVCATGLAQMLAFSTPGVFMLMPLPMWLRDPVRRDFLWARQCELIGPTPPDIVNLKNSTDQLLAYLDEHVPRSDRLKLVAAVSNWGEDIYYGQAFAYQGNLSRPDIEVIPLAEPHFIDIEPYRGLRPEYFAFYVRLVNGQFAPCCDGSGQVVLANRDEGHQAPLPFERFARKLMRRYVGRVPELPNVLVLEHSEVSHLELLPQGRPDTLILVLRLKMRDQEMVSD